MKNQSATISLKRFLILVFICFSALGFSQSNALSIGNMKNSKDIKFDFFGRDLLIQSPSGSNDWIELSGSKIKPVLKKAVINQSRLDSILEMKNYGTYIDRTKWQFDYDSNNRLKTSSRLFFDMYNKFKNKKEFRVYDEQGQSLSLVCTEIPSFSKDTFITTYIEENQYLNGNLMKQNIIDNSFGMPTPLTRIFNYNEKNQLTKKMRVTLNGMEENILTTEYIYDQDSRRKYEIQVYGKGPEFYVTKNEYKVTDTTLIIQERSGSIYNYKQPSDLDKIRNWQDGETYLLNFDQFGQTISIEESYSNIKQKIKYTYFKVEYEYTSTGKLKQSTFYLPDDQLNFKTWNKSTIIKNSYNADGNLLEYEKTFYDARVNEWVAEETKTYYYNSTKSAVTSIRENKTSDFYIYPNPATDRIYFSIAPEINSNYIIYNLLGEVVANGDFNSQSISISQLTSGTYIIKVGNNGVGFVNRFVKR